MARHALGQPAGRIAHCIDGHACTTGCRTHSIACRTAEYAGYFLRESSSAPGMHNVICNGWDCEITGYPNDQENQISRICGTEKGIAEIFDLANIQYQHLFLYFTDNGTENICYRQPKEDIDVPG